MRVLHVAQSAGDGTPVATLVDALARRGVDSDVLPIGGLQNWKAVAALRGRLRDARYDLVHAQCARSTLVAAAQRRVPVVGHLHGELRSGHAFLARWAARLTPHILVSDAASAQKLKAPHIRVVPLGVDATRFRPEDRAAACDRLDLDPRHQWILFPSDPGRPEKNLALFEATVQRVIRAIPTARPLFLHRVAAGAVPDVLNAADVLLHTAIAATSATVVKEALLCGLPVVSTPVEPVVTLLKGVWPSAVAAPDPNALAERTIAVLNEHARSDGRRKQRQWAPQRAADAILQFYREALRAPASRAA